jgi:hypothetical protein
MIKNVLIAGSFLYGFLLFAQTQVVFLEVKNSQGQKVVLEPDFPYAHVAVTFDGVNFLHSHPQTGVIQSSLDELEQFGTPRENLFAEEPLGAADLVKNWLGKPYDSSFSWGNERFYCSELVAKALGISPEPMHFDPGLWPPSFQDFEGKPGISPGKIYQKIKAQLFSF